jgi:hypothetical protein
MLNQAMNVRLWESEMVAGNPLDSNNIITFSNEFRQMLGFHNSKLGIYKLEAVCCNIAIVGTQHQQKNPPGGIFALDGLFCFY